MIVRVRIWWGRFPAPWHNLNINDMGDNILRKAADELKKYWLQGFRMAG